MFNSALGVLQYAVFLLCTRRKLAFQTSHARYHRVEVFEDFIRGRGV
jgi:hypothetical protein